MCCTTVGLSRGLAARQGAGWWVSGWQCFTNGGAANYGFYDDQWERTVAEGRHSQLIEVNTKGHHAGGCGPLCGHLPDGGGGGLGGVHAESERA